MARVRLELSERAQSSRETELSVEARRLEAAQGAARFAAGEGRHGALPGAGDGSSR